MLILRSFLSGDRIGLGPSEDGGVYVNVSSLSFRQPLAAEFAMDVKEGISRDWLFGSLVVVCFHAVFFLPRFVLDGKVDGDLVFTRDLGENLPRLFVVS
jgi:hypothetical protein